MPPNGPNLRDTRFLKICASSLFLPVSVSGGLKAFLAAMLLRAFLWKVVSWCGSILRDMGWFVLKRRLTGFIFSAIV